MQPVHLFLIRFLRNDKIDVNLLGNRLSRIKQEIVIPFLLAIIDQGSLGARVTQAGRNAKDRLEAGMRQHGPVQGLALPLGEFLKQETETDDRMLPDPRYTETQTAMEEQPFELLDYLISTYFHPFINPTTFQTGNVPGKQTGKPPLS